MDVAPLSSVPRSLDEIISAGDAAHDKTPSVVLAAFVPKTITVGDRTLRPMSILSWLHLETIKSPFLTAGDGQVIGVLDTLRTLYVLLHDEGHIADLLAQGEKAFSDAALKLAADLPLAGLNGLANTIAQHIAAEFAPSAKLGAPEKPDGDSPLLVPQSAGATVAAAP